MTPKASRSRGKTSTRYLRPVQRQAKLGARVAPSIKLLRAPNQQPGHRPRRAVLHLPIRPPRPLDSRPRPNQARYLPRCQPIRRHLFRPLPPRHTPRQPRPKMPVLTSHWAASPWTMNLSSSRCRTLDLALSSSPASCSTGRPATASWAEFGSTAHLSGMEMMGPHPPTLIRDGPVTECWWAEYPKS